MQRCRALQAETYFPLCKLSYRKNPLALQRSATLQRPPRWRPPQPGRMHSLGKDGRTRTRTTHDWKGRTHEED